MKTKSKLVVISILAMAYLPVGHSFAQDQDGFSNPLEVPRPLGCLVDGFDCFSLFNRCEPVDLAVTVGTNDIGLTEERVRMTIESRLRAARLYNQSAGPSLSVIVSLSEDMNAYSYDLSFYKWMTDMATNETRLAGRWSSGGYGTHGGDAGFILQGISEGMDEFINEYLRVNESACD